MFRRKWIRKRSSIKDSDFFALSLRIASIRKKRPSDDLINGDAPIVWERMSNGYRIIDLQLHKFMQALHFVLAYYSNSEPLFKTIKLYDDATSMKTFMNMVFKQMEGMIGFCAIREGTNELVGVLIASIFKKFNWVIKKGQGETLCHVMNLKNFAFAKSRFVESIYINKSVHIDIICVKPDHQKRGIGTALLRSCITRVSNFTSIVFGQFTSSAAQTIAKRLNFDIVGELPYKNLSLQNIKYEIFESCYPENYSIAHMMLKIIPKLKLSVHTLETKTISEEKIKIELKEKIDFPKKKKKRIHVVY